MVPHSEKPIHQQILFRLYQAQMWRRYILDWDGKPGGYGYSRRWLVEIGHYSREGMLRRARINIRLAQRLRRRPAKEDARHG